MAKKKMTSTKRTTKVTRSKRCACCAHAVLKSHLQGDGIGTIRCLGIPSRLSDTKRNFAWAQAGNQPEESDDEAMKQPTGDVGLLA